MLTELQVPPGIVQVGTDYEQKNRWKDGNLIRWVNGRMRAVGGWTRITNTALTGVPSNLHGWRVMTNTNFTKWMAIGTHQKLYAYADGTYNDITPTGFVPGHAQTQPGAGYSAGAFNDEDYGDARSSGDLRITAHSWSLDNWGSDLIACSYSNGSIYRFDPTVTVVPAAVIPNAPTENTAALVTDQRFLVALGAGGNPFRVQWSDREDYNTWTASSTNLAGYLDLATTSEIILGIKVNDAVLILTRTDAHLMNYIGAPLVYGIDRIGEDCGAVGPRSAITADNRVFWMSKESFYMFDGYVKPLPCDVYDYVFDDLDFFQRDQVTAGHNSAFNEVWWHFPSNSAAYNDKYVAYNYQEGYWTIGDMGRTCWMDGGLFEYPIAGDSSGHLYYQEYGWTNSGASRKADIFAKTGPIQLDAGDRIVAVNQLIIDEDPLASGTVGVSFELAANQNAARTTVGPFVAGSNGYTDCRFTARQVNLTVKPQRDDRWDYGILRADIRPGGRR